MVRVNVLPPYWVFNLQYGSCIIHRNVVYMYTGRLPVFRMKILTHYSGFNSEFWSCIFHRIMVFSGRCLLIIRINITQDRVLKMEALRSSLILVLIHKNARSYILEKCNLIFADRAPQIAYTFRELWEKALFCNIRRLRTAWTTAILPVRRSRWIFPLSKYETMKIYQYFPCV
jgi:hypothetical protein